MRTRMAVLALLCLSLVAFAQQSAQQQITLTVNPAPLVITSSVMPVGQVSVTYSQKLQATGGVAPYKWALAAGSSLPAGLSLATDGTISGTPTTAGTFNFTVTVTDSQGTTAMKRMGRKPQS